MIEQITIISFSILLCYILTRALIPIAPKLGLIDIPSTRKKHSGDIPLVGGIAIYSSVLVCTILFAQPQLELLSIVTIGGILSIIGSLDDKYGLSPRLRLSIQFIAGFLLAYTANIELKSLGNLFGFGVLELGLLSIPLTAVGIAALANAYNMTDGIDGLAASLGIVAFAFMLFAEYGNLHLSERLVLSFFISSLTVYLIFNFAIKPLTPSKVFMGDAGSMFIGFSIASFAIYLTQNNRFNLTPVTVIWFVAVPLFDMLATMIRRVRKKQSPFYPDRTHLHHLLIHLGLNGKEALTAILTFSCLLAFTGLFLREHNISEVISFSTLVTIFGCYLYLTLHAWRIKRMFRK